MAFLNEQQKSLAIELKKLGIPIKLSGFWYLLESVNLVADEVPFTDHIFSKTVYPVIAKRHKVSAASVEVSIRRAVKRAWESGNEELRYLTDKMGIEKPTNRVLISYLAMGKVNPRVIYNVDRNKPVNGVGEQLKLSIVSDVNVW